MEKNLKIFIGSFLICFLVFAYFSDEKEFEPKYTELDLSNSKEILDLKEDVVAKASKTDAKTLLNLCFIDFAFDERNRETVFLVYNTPDPGKIRSILLENPNFLRVCSVRGLDTSEIQPYITLNKNITGWN